MLSHRDYTRDVEQLGFATIGSYAHDAFVIEHGVRLTAAVYIWMLETNGIVIPVRVGETGRLRSRFSSYNGWLRGGQWPGERRNAREHEKARLTKLRLGPAARVLAASVPDKVTGLAVERFLLDLWKPALDLNFELAGSWGRARVKEWSTAYDLARRED
jgi:hypothetical protein